MISIINFKILNKNRIEHEYVNFISNIDDILTKTKIINIIKLFEKDFCCIFVI